jgi:hypothetical protein
MGFELYLMSYAKGKPAGISREAVRALFPVVEEESESNHWRVRFDSNQTCTIDVTSAGSDPAFLESLCIHRPCGDTRFYEAILSILRMGSIVMVFPGCESPLVANETAAADLPLDIADSMAPSRCVRSAEEILRIIRSA